MSDRVERFQVEGTPRIALRLPTGEVRFVGGDPGWVEVRLMGRQAAIDRFLVEDRGGEIVIEPAGGGFGRFSGVDVEVKAGDPAAIRARLASGNLTVSPPAQSLHVDSASGNVTAGDVVDGVAVKTASGDVRLGSVGGRVEATAASGDIHLAAGSDEISARTASGGFYCGDAGGGVTAHSASGDVDVRRFTGDSFNAKTMSGDVRLGVTSGRRFSVSLQSLSGKVRTDFPVASGDAGTPEARLTIKTVSGDVTVGRAD